MNTPIELLFLGLPETGKTTYFVALDEVLQRQTDKHGLVSGGFSANRSYIEKAKKAWRAGKAVERTSLMTTDEQVELLVRHSKSNTTARLTAPDVSGEFFDDQWADRKWAISYRTRLASVAGVFVFINAAVSGRNPEMTEAWKNLPQGEMPTKPNPWTARAAAKQVKLVELLQFISERGKTRQPLSLAIMISAWDVIESEISPKVRPEKFLEDEWSLLHQYLQANPELFRSRIYGVSARGGDDAAQTKLVQLSPHERVWLKDGAEVTKDLTRPLRWLLDWD